MTIIINEAASEDAKLKTLPNFHCTMNMINNTNSQILCMVDRRRRIMGSQAWFVESEVTMINTCNFDKLLEFGWLSRTECSLGDWDEPI